MKIDKRIFLSIILSLLFFAIYGFSLYYYRENTEILSFLSTIGPLAYVTMLTIENKDDPGYRFFTGSLLFFALQGILLVFNRDNPTAIIALTGILAVLGLAYFRIMWNIYYKKN